MTINIPDILNQLSNDPLTTLAVPLFILAIVAEAVASKSRNLGLYEARDTATSILMLILSSLVDVAPKVLAFVIFLQLHEISPLRDLVVRQWWAWIALFFLDDFFCYWFHRANHQVRLFWAGHVPHHSSVKLNFGTALRQGIGERIHKYAFWLALPVLGFDPLMIFTVIAANLVYQFWVHTELVVKLPTPIEFIFNTPSHHRVHHASNLKYLDCNHAGVLIIWDRMFGTFVQESKDEAPNYGLTKNINTYNPALVAFAEYYNLWRDVRSASRWQDKLCYLFLAPGWRHDGDDHRTTVLRAKQKPF